MTSFYRRKDGKDMNMQYCPDNRQKPPAEPRILTQDPPSPGRVTPSDRFCSIRSPCGPFRFRL